MNWSDIKRSLDSEFDRLESERVKQMKEDEKLADFLMTKFEESLQDSKRLEGITVSTDKELDACSSCNGLGYHPPFTFDQNQEASMTCGKCNNINHKRLATVVKGSSVTEFNQNWKEKVEAN